MHISDWQPPKMQGRGAKGQGGAPLRLRAAVEAMRPGSPIRRITPRRWPGSRPGEAAKGVLLLAVILAAACACLLLLDALGVSLGATTDVPFLG